MPPYKPNLAAAYCKKAKDALDCMRGLMADYDLVISADNPRLELDVRAVEAVLSGHQARFDENFKLMVRAHNERVAGGR